MGAPTARPHPFFSISFPLFSHYQVIAKDMLYTIAVLLLILWAIGLLTSYTLGGFIHILLVVAVVLVLVRIIQGRRPV